MKTMMLVGAALLALSQDPKPESTDGALRFDLPKGWKFSKQTGRERVWVSGTSRFMIEVHKGAGDTDPVKARDQMMKLLLDGGAELVKVGSKETGAGKALHVRYVRKSTVGDVLFVAHGGRCYWILYERESGAKCPTCARDAVLEGFLKGLRWAAK